MDRFDRHEYREHQTALRERREEKLERFGEMPMSHIDNLKIGLSNALASHGRAEVGRSVLGDGFYVFRRVGEMSSLYLCEDGTWHGGMKYGEKKAGGTYFASKNEAEGHCDRFTRAVSTAVSAPAAEQQQDCRDERNAQPQPDGR